MSLNDVFLRKIINNLANHNHRANSEKSFHITFHTEIQAAIKTEYTLKCRTALASDFTKSVVLFESLEMDMLFQNYKALVLVLVFKKHLSKHSSIFAKIIATYLLITEIIKL